MERREYVFSAIVYASFAALEPVLLTTQPAFRVCHDIDFEWRRPGADVNLRWDGDEYLGSGYMTGTREEVVETFRQLANALVRAGVRFVIEVDDDLADERVFTYGEYEPHPR